MISPESQRNSLLRSAQTHLERLREAVLDVMFANRIPVAVREVLNHAPHAQVTFRDGHGIAQSRREGDFHVLWNGQDALHLMLHGVWAKGTEYLHTDAET